MTLLYLLDMIGTVTFAASGAWADVRREMDLLGVLVLGTVTAIGGGTLRDMLLGDTPPFCLKDENYLWLSLIVSLLIFFGHRHLDRLKHPLLYFDAIGLGTFVIVGTGKALEFKLGPFCAALMGIMTVTAGGAIRDLLSTRVPLILQREIYASACLAGAGLMAILYQTTLPQILIFILAAATVIILRLLAVARNWARPKAQQSPSMGVSYA